jgi:hypothetical protein
LTNLKLDYQPYAMLRVNDPIIDFKFHEQPLIAALAAEQILESTALIARRMMFAITSRS